MAREKMDLLIHFVEASSRMIQASIWSKGWPLAEALSIRGNDFLAVPLLEKGGPLNAEGCGGIEPGVYRGKVLNVVKHVDGGLNISDPMFSHFEIMFLVMDRTDLPEPNEDY